VATSFVADRRGAARPFAFAPQPVQMQMEPAPSLQQSHRAPPRGSRRDAHMVLRGGGALASFISFCDGVPALAILAGACSD